MSTRLALAIVVLFLTASPSLLASQAVPIDRSTAASLLGSMPGSWRIANSAGGEVGVRTIRPGLDELTLEWEEVFGETTLRGFLGYDAAIEKFYILAVSTNDASRTMFLSGTWEAEGRAIRWEPVGVTPDDRVANRHLITSTMYLSEQNAFRWSAFDDRWSFYFVRQ